jgi:hypothetical protein
MSFFERMMKAKERKAKEQRRESTIGRKEKAENETGFRMRAIAKTTMTALTA